MHSYQVINWMSRDRSCYAPRSAVQSSSRMPPGGRTREQCSRARTASVRDYMRRGVELAPVGSLRRLLPFCLITKHTMDDSFRQAALDYHRLPRPGKIAVTPTKDLVTQRDLALAYSPGVAAACEEIVADPGRTRDYTALGNLIGVITNGTAVLGLGAIGPAAAKPVMEGKAVLFKNFAGIDVFDIEVNELDPDKLVDIIASLEPTFGGINLEDIK